jgi:glycosyltransferase involved in cell wall biosynthesis
MVGVGRIEERLRANLPPNVELLGWLPREALTALYGRAAGFVHVGEEDFGISMVESLASGTPVIALGRGGAVDIVRPDVDGVLIDDPDLDALRAAITTAAERDWDTDALVARSREFSTQRFVERFEAHLRGFGVR